MMPNAYGSQSTMPMPPQTMTSAGGKQQYASQGWAYQQPDMPTPPRPTGNLPNTTQETVTPTQNNFVNGNYQQQLSQSFGGMSMNPMKQTPMAAQNQILSGENTNSPSSNKIDHPQEMHVSGQSLSNGSPSVKYPNSVQSVNVNNNLNSYSKGTSSNVGLPGLPSLPFNSTSTPNQHQQIHPNTSGNNLAPEQNVSTGVNQMMVNSGSVAGMSQFPPSSQIDKNNALLSPLSRQAQQQHGSELPSQFSAQIQQNVVPPIPGNQQSLNLMPQSGVPRQQLEGPPSFGQQHLGMSQMSSQLPRGQPPLPGQQYHGMTSLQGQQQQAMPPTLGQQQQAMPPNLGQQQPAMPPTLGQQQPAMPPTLGQQQPAMPPTLGQQQPAMPPTLGQQQQAMPPTLGQQQHSMPPTLGQQQQAMPPTLGQQQHGMPPAPGQIQTTMPPTSRTQQSPMPPIAGQQPPSTTGLAVQQHQLGAPPLPGKQPGMPPMFGQQPNIPPMMQPGMPPMSGYLPQSNQPLMPGTQSSQMIHPQTGQLMQGRTAYNQLSGSMYQQPQYEQQPKRLDPDQMPNPIQVMSENQRNAGGAFLTNQAGLLPPLVTTKYVVQDQGNVSPRFLRSSLYCVPATADLLKTTALPFSLIISPYARITDGEYEPPIVDFGDLGPIRCNRCKAYMSPNMQFVDAGRRFQCLMCKVSTEVPTEYFQHLDHTGQRVDKYERPELVLGTYEFLATKDYCRNNASPEIPAFIFVIDVSYNTMKSGLVHLLCSQIKEILKNLPVDQGQEKSNMRVGFITYNNSVHFYNINSNLAQPQMLVVGDIQDMFMPLLDGFLCHPEESEVVIDALMEQIPKMFVDTKETETILYPAIQAGLEALKAANCSGKLLVFNSSLPIAEAPGKLKSRDDRKLLGTDKEKTVLLPQCQSYNTLGQECVQNGCSVDLFLFNNSYIDVATIGQVARLTGGEIFKYTYFQADVDGKRLIADITKNVSRPIAFDAVMRVRTSAGVRATDFYGHFFMTNTTDVELASIDCDKSIAIEIKHDDKLPVEENVYVQVALLFTSCSGQRRLRILNIALKVTTTIADVFKSCDLDAIMLFFAKQSCFKLMELTPKAVKDTLIHRSAQILACYRKHCTTPSSAGQLILPECLKLLPLYTSCLLKNDAISGGSDMTIDDRSYVIQLILSMDLNMFVSYLYPRFMPIHNVDPDGTELPMSMRCTHEKISEDGAYILENGVHFFIWLGQSLPQSFVQPLFGVQCTQQINAERFAITGDNALAQRIRGIIENVMANRTRYMRITCVRQNDKLESVFRHFLIEDRGTDGSASYVDFLCHMHKEIKELLS